MRYMLMRKADETTEAGDATLELRRYFTLDDFDLDKHRDLARLPRELNVRLCFAGNCREAMTFYAKVTGGRLEAVIPFGETPAAAETPPEWHERIIHASLNIRGRRLMGADMTGDGYQAPRAALLVFKEHGALRMVECWGDDVPDGTLTSFSMAVKRQPDETVIFSWIVWPSREVRDRGMARIMEDPRLSPDANPMPFDGKRLIYGGFEVVIDE